MAETQVSEKVYQPMKPVLPSGERGGPWRALRRWRRRETWDGSGAGVICRKGAEKAADGEVLSRTADANTDLGEREAVRQTRRWRVGMCIVGTKPARPHWAGGGMGTGASCRLAGVDLRWTGGRQVLCERVIFELRCHGGRGRSFHCM